MVDFGHIELAAGLSAAILVGMWAVSLFVPCLNAEQAPVAGSGRCAQGDRFVQTGEGRAR